MSLVFHGALVKSIGSKSSVPNQQGTYISKVFYGQEPPSGESTTTECGLNYQLLAVIY